MGIFLQNMLERRCQACAEPFSGPGRAFATGAAGAAVGAWPFPHQVFSAGFCPGCAAGLQALRKDFCPVCGEIYQGGEAEGLCPGCRIAPPPWGGIYFHAAYSGLLRELIRRLKFGGALYLAPVLGGMLARHPELAASTAAARGYDGLVPIPLHHSRLRERGFNQSAEIAKELCKILNLPILGGLERIRVTRRQTGLSREQRLHNLRGAFEARPALRGKKILLLDDVMTTGATLASAAKALLHSGAAAVDVAVVARAPARDMLRAVRRG